MAIGLFVVRGPPARFQRRHDAAAFSSRQQRPVADLVQRAQTAAAQAGLLVENADVDAG